MPKVNIAENVQRVTFEVNGEVQEGYRIDNLSDAELDALFAEFGIDTEFDEDSVPTVEVDYGVDV